jgi:hypothetical protein
MPHIGKSIPSNNSSEIVSNIDSGSESSSSVDSSDGSGDEGITIPENNTNVTSATTSSASTLPAHLSPLKIIVGSFCALAAVTGGIMCMYASTHQDQNAAIKSDLDRALLGVGLPMMLFGSLVAIGSCVYNSETTS